VTILEFGKGVFEVKSTSGDTQLGGTDMDAILLQHVIEQLRAQAGADISVDRFALARIREAVEKAKIRLSSEDEAEINAPFVAPSVSLSMKLTRTEMDRLVEPIVNKCRRPLLQALSDAQLKPGEIDHVILVGGPTRMPIVRRFVKEIMGKEPEAGIDPMEVVAMGAAIQGAVLTGELHDVLLLDVTPLSLGIETFGGLMNVIIPRNTTIPSKAGEAFTTAVDNQREVLIHVLQGERELAKDNFSLGRFSIDVEPAAAGVPRVGVQFTIDADGILHVLARDLRTGKEKVVRIKSAVDISDEKVQQMVKESVEHALEDVKERQWIEARLDAEVILRATSKGLAEFGSKLDEGEVQAIKDAVKEVYAMMETKDIGKLKAATDKLDRVTQRLAGLMMEDSLRQRIAGKPQKS